MRISNRTHLAPLKRGLLVAALAIGATAQEAPIATPATPARAPAKNLVVVTLDTLRADRLGCYGYFRDTTPQIDLLAARSLRFERCLTPVAQTAPSHISIFTGVGPVEHGVESNHALSTDSGLRTSATLQTLAEALRRAGMRTGGFVGATPVKRASGLDAGFDVWSEPSTARRPGADVIADAVRFMDECAGAPFFVWIHIFDAHEPLLPPFVPQHYLDLWKEDPAAAAWRVDRGITRETVVRGQVEYGVVDAHHAYDGALRFLDDQFGTLLTSLHETGREKETVLVVVADHGTALGQHAHWGHGMCWDDHFRVPLIVHVPGIAPKVIDTSLSTLDLWPTVMGLAPELANESLLAQCRGVDVLAADFAPRPLFGVAALGPKTGAVTFGRWKLIQGRASTVHLFDLEADPYEQNDIAKANPSVVARLTRLIEADSLRQRQSRALHASGAAGGGTVDPKILEELRALGYTDDGSSDAPEPEPPPKKRRDRKDDPPIPR